MRLLVVFLCVFVCCNGAKILGVFNHPGASHTFLGKVLLKNLAKKGHEIVMISAFPLDEPMKNYKDIPMPGLLEDMKRRELMYFEKEAGFANLKNMTLHHTEEVFKDVNVQKLLQSNQSFDLVLVDFFFNSAMLMFGHVFKAPVVILSSFGNNMLLNSFTGNYLPLSYVPGLGQIIDDNMSFKQRLIMAVGSLYVEYMRMVEKPKQFDILQRYFTNPPSIQELEENIALVLTNSHFTFETARPNTPNIVPIGGFHVEEPPKLPEDLQNFLDSGENGVVFVSFGSQIKSSNLKEDQLKMLLHVFGRLSMKVLWKFEDDSLGMPENTKTVKWAPQTSILAHSNVRVFVGHCGALSLIESIHFAVPLICIPFNGDAYQNAAYVHSRQIGLLKQLEDLNAESFFHAIQEVATNPVYKKNVKLHSVLLREQPIKPLDNAIFWIEQVCKHGNIQQIKPFSMKLPWYKYYMIDVITLLASVVVSVLFLIKMMLSVIAKVLKNVCMKCWKMISKKKQN